MSRGSIAYGLHAVTARLRHRPQAIRGILVDNSRQDARMRRLMEAAAAAGVKVEAVEGRRLDELTRDARHQGVVALVDSESLALTLEDVLDGLEERALLLVLDGVQDPHNLGACLRVADALGVHAVVAPRDRAVGITPTVEKVASGAAETVPYLMVTNLARTLRDLKDRGIWVIGAAHRSEKSLASCDFGVPVALVLGAESDGLRRLTAETCDELVSIPMLGTVESLNVSVAAGICLYEARRQRAAKAPGQLR